jgi:hypothetical protein
MTVFWGGFRSYVRAFPRKQEPINCCKQANSHPIRPERNCQRTHSSRCPEPGSGRIGTPIQARGALRNELASHCDRVAL